ncbi:hypothetical protein CC1G_11227 [Coprinopsis cinerea okayama7|uniref:Uncharacterized protein n=1 Tax=Coprinopsis cinerea (strain Okayama-7 / 130 / ATCC MYA-4618 / FGSC 9003) TaxID=240176 RepID=A8N126_COPC7|nr:hypothetical protein CC1G_11227 [Coprinopsis cinerea okayama7\|eukprot:XP_001828575.2 hypothetical protein CC1G_11227 [Coprinopsis cinerea okayama7\
MDLQNAPRQRSSPANDHSSPASSVQNHQNMQQQLFMAQQQGMPPSPYTFPAQQQAQGSWTPSINATPFYPSFYQQQLQQQSPQSYPSPLPQQAPYFDPANAQLAQWAYQQMLFNAQQHGYSALPPQHALQAQRAGGGQLGPSDYFANQIPSPFNNFPSGTPPPHNPRGGAGDHQGQTPQYPGFHPYRRPNRQQSHNSSDNNNDWRSGAGHNQLPHAPYMRSDASGSTSSVNSTGSRQRTNSNQSGHSGHSAPATGPASRSRSNTASSAASSSARGSPSPAQSSSPTPSPLRNHHNRNGSSSSSNSSATTTTRPSGITPSVPTTATSPTTTSASSSSSSPAPRLTRPSPLSQGNFTAEKRMSRDDSDLAAMLSPPPDATSSRNGGLKSRLRRALSFNPSQTFREPLKEETEDDDDASIKASAINGASSKPKSKFPAAAGSSKLDSSQSGLVDDGASTATVQTKKKGRAASLFNARFNASTDNISLSSTVSSASVMIRKLGSLGNLARRNSLAGITSLFKDKDKDGDRDRKGKKKDKKGAKAEASEASVSHVTAELDRSGDWSTSADLNGLTPAAKLARQHTLKSNAEAAAKAKAEKEAAAAAASNGSTVNGTGGINGTAVGVPAWDKNTATRNGVPSPTQPGPGIHINEDGTRVLVEEDEEESDDGHYASSHGHQNYNTDGWDDDDWDADPEEDVTIRQGLQRASLDSNDEVEPWAVDVRRSIERTKMPKKGILKNAQNYCQSNYGPNSTLSQTRTRSNSYNSPGTQSELGPLARIPSPDPDHIDGLHRHGSHSTQHSSSQATESVPSLPPLSFDSNSSPIAMSFPSSAKELPDTPSGSAHSTEQGNRTSIFQNPSFNSSAPVLSNIASPASTMPPRSATAPQKRLTFATSLAVYDTFAATVYDRRSEPATWSRLTPALAQRIKEELNSYKMEEMEVHAASRIHTQFFV